MSGQVDRQGAQPVLLIAPPILTGLAASLAEPVAIERLWDYPDPAAFVAAHGERVRAILTIGEFKLPPVLLAGLPNLGLIACISAGYDAIDIGWCREHGVAVTHSPAINAEDVADHAVAATIAAWRGIVEGDRLVREGGWSKTYRGPQRRSLRGRAVGIVGLGHIGRAIGERLQAFGTRIAWWGPNPKPDAPWPRTDGLMALAQASDLLFVAVRAGPSNRHLVDAAVIEAVGPQGVICNVSRGLVIDQGALIDALKAGRLGSAALDVFDPEPTPAELWRDVPNTVLTPHTAGATAESVPAMVALARENLNRFFAGEPLVSPIPELAT
jgi:lactate dehydrogenase-like 2-hydroxyacid dehydrogenase